MGTPKKNPVGFLGCVPGSLNPGILATRNSSCSTGNYGEPSNPVMITHLVFVNLGEVT